MLLNILSYLCIHHTHQSDISSTLLHTSHYVSTSSISICDLNWTKWWLQDDFKCGFHSQHIFNWISWMWFALVRLGKTCHLCQLITSLPKYLCWQGGKSWCKSNICICRYQCRVLLLSLHYPQGVLRQLSLRPSSIQDEWRWTFINVFSKISSTFY